MFSSKCCNAVLIVILGLFFALLNHSGDTYANIEEEKLAPVKSIGISTYKYDIVPAKAPVLYGIGLRIGSFLGTNQILGPLIRGAMLNHNNLYKIRGLALQVQEPAVYFPIVRLNETEHQKHQKKALETNPGKILQEGFSLKKTQQIYKSVEDFASAYRAGTLTPTQAVNNFVENRKKFHEKGHVVFSQLTELQSLLEQAEQSEKRIKQGKALSIFDGVLVAIKDEIDVKGFPTWLGRKPDPSTPPSLVDDIPVARLIEAGAIIVGKTVMTEFGASPVGYNSHYKGAKNPYNITRFSGGSSSGSAAAVALGLVPVALGTDSGGSIRIPSSLSGVFGLNPTYSRVPFLNDAGNTMGSLHLGPIAATARDAALTYLLIAKPVNNHFYTNEYGGGSINSDSINGSVLVPPPPHLYQFDKIDSLADISVGVFWDQFNDAEPEVILQATKAIDSLKKLGATIKNVSIPHLQTLAAVHAITVSSEMSAMLEDFYVRKKQELELTSALQIGLGTSMSAHSFIAAARLRGWGIKYFQNTIFADVDVFITPTTPMTAPELKPEYLDENVYDTELIIKVMKFIFLSNILGFPSMNVPVGYDSQNLPVGLCVNGAHWNDALLLRIAHALEVHHLQRVAPNP